MKFKSLIFFLFLLLLSCSSKDYITLKDTSNLNKYVEKRISLKGDISDMPWQHLILYDPDYPYILYFDVNEDQIVIYSKIEIKCKKNLWIFGKVIEVKGTSKRPGSNEPYIEYGILVNTFLCN